MSKSVGNKTFSDSMHLLVEQGETISLGSVVFPFCFMQIFSASIESKSTRGQWSKDYGPIAIESTYSVQCFGLHQWNNIHFLEGLCHSLDSHSTRGDPILRCRCQCRKPVRQNSFVWQQHGRNDIHRFGVGPGMLRGLFGILLLQGGIRSSKFFYLSSLGYLYATRLGYF